MLKEAGLISRPPKHLVGTLFLFLGDPQARIM
jgi:hypothetical protein